MKKYSYKFVKLKLLSNLARVVTDCGARTTDSELKLNDFGVFVRLEVKTQEFFPHFRVNICRVFTHEHLLE